MKKSKKTSDNLSTLKLALQESQEHFRAAFDYAGIGMGLVGLDGHFLQVNPMLCKILGYTEAELLDKTSHSLTHSSSIVNEKNYLQQLVTGKSISIQYEKCYKHKSGRFVWCLANIVLVSDNKHKPIHFLYQLQDISELKTTEAQLLNLTRHDPLTGLANRALLEENINEMIVNARQQGEQVALLLFDLDQFKLVNDTLGHEAGDLVLRAVADRIRGQIRSKDILARLGSDIFVVILSETNHVQVPTKVAQKILTTISKPFNIHGKEILITASVGISTYPINGKNSQVLLKNADIAMHHAKNMGGNCYQFCTLDMPMQTREKMDIQHALRHAIVEKEFKLYYQPKYDLRTKKITGVEALLRWPRENGKMIEPSVFIPVAEEIGVINRLGEWVLQTACQQAKKWRSSSKKLANLTMAINISAVQLRDTELVHIIEKILKKTGLPPHLLELEITEGAILHELMTATTTLNMLRDIGVKLTIDDFGIGYSSFAYLKRFHIDSIKIDQSFIRNIIIDANDAALVKAIIVMAHTLNIRVVAEGVETAEQMQFLIEQDCDEIQGYYSSEPESSEVTLATELSQS